MFPTALEMVQLYILPLIKYLPSVSKDIYCNSKSPYDLPLIKYKYDQQTNFNKIKLHKAYLCHAIYSIFKYPVNDPYILNTEWNSSTTAVIPTLYNTYIQYLKRKSSRLTLWPARVFNVLPSLFLYYNQICCNHST